MQPRKHNDAEQGIEQGQENKQNAQCVSGEITFASCNNVGIAIARTIRRFGIRPTIIFFLKHFRFWILQLTIDTLKICLITISF